MACSTWNSRRATWKTRDEPAAPSGSNLP
jgi:hypothetical protein